MIKLFCLITGSAILIAGIVQWVFPDSVGSKWWIGLIYVSTSLPLLGLAIIEFIESRKDKREVNNADKNK